MYRKFAFLPVSFTLVKELSDPITYSVKYILFIDRLFAYLVVLTIACNL